MKTSAIRQKCHLFSRGNFWTKKLILINKKVICDFTNWMVRTIVGTDLERGDFAGLKRCLLWIYLYYFFTWETVITIFRRQAIITYIWFCKSSLKKKRIFLSFTHFSPIEWCKLFNLGKFTILKVDCVNLFSKKIVTSDIFFYLPIFLSEIKKIW